MKLLPHRYFGRATGRHRPKQGPAGLAPQTFVDCPRCEVETAATRHGDALLCAEGHLVVPGGAE